MKQSKNLFKSLGFLTLSLCALCCAAPIAGIVFTASAMTLLAEYWAPAAVTVGMPVLILLAVGWIKKRKANACDINCSCKEANTTQEG